MRHGARISEAPAPLSKRAVPLYEATQPGREGGEGTSAVRRSVSSEHQRPGIDQTQRRITDTIAATAVVPRMCRGRTKE